MTVAKAPKFPSHQTVEWWIEQLKEFNPKAVVHIASAPDSPPMCMLGLYYADKKGGCEDIKKVWIDVGDYTCD